MVLRPNSGKIRQGVFIQEYQLLIKCNKKSSASLRVSVRKKSESVS
jgi:hypothetical protein